MVVALERFEGDTLLLPSRIGGDDIEQLEHTPHEEMWCDTLDTHTDIHDPDGTCPIEPDIGFRDALRDRAVWLVSLLILQSISGIILYQNELVLSNHPSSTCKKYIDIYIVVDDTCVSLVGHIVTNVSLSIYILYSFIFL